MFFDISVNFGTFVWTYGIDAIQYSKIASYLWYIENFSLICKSFWSESANICFYYIKYFDIFHDFPILDIVSLIVKMVNWINGVTHPSSQNVSYK